MLTNTWKTYDKANSFHLTYMSCLQWSALETLWSTLSDVILIIELQNSAE